MNGLLRRRLLYLGWLAGGLTALAAGWYLLGASLAAAPGQNYVEGVVGEPKRINPLYAGLNEVDADLSALLFNGLTRITGDGTPRADLAERWEITPDGLSYTFHLRPEVFWHDGQRLDARDVAFTIEQVQAAGFRGAPALAAAWSGVMVTVAGPLTLTIRLPAPSASFLTRTALGVLPEHLLAGLDPAELFEAPFNRAPVGTGPYRLVTLDRRMAVLERNTSYGPAVPALPGFELRFFGDRRALNAALLAGELDGALLSEAPATAEREALEARTDLATTAFLSSGYTLLYMNNQRDPLNDPRLRRAIAAAIDTTALLTAVMGGSGLAGDGPIVPGSWAYAPGDWPSPDEANDLFEAAAWLRTGEGVRVRAGRPLSLQLVTNTSAVREALTEAVAERLRAHGVEVAVTAMPAAALLATRIEPRDYELMIFGWETDIDPDPYGAWHTSQILLPGRNVAGYHDALADALMEAARTTLDIGERLDLYARFTGRFAETAPAVVLHYPARMYVHSAALRGLSPGLLFEPASRFRDVHLWRFEPRE